MSLQQLAALGAQDRSQRNLAIEYFTEDFINNELRMERNCWA
jgi:hypothetical protein